MMRRVWVVILMVPWLFGGTLAAGELSAERQYAGYPEIQVAYLYNFIKFVSWPEQLFQSADDPIVIGIMGRNPFGTALQQLSQKTVQGRRIVIKNSEGVGPPPGCHLIYIATSEAVWLDQILGALRHKGVLTVSPIKGFASSGGMIEFVVLNKRMKFNVNLLSAKTEGIAISSHVLHLANRVLY